MRGIVLGSLLALASCDKPRPSNSLEEIYQPLPHISERDSRALEKLSDSLTSLRENGIKRKDKLEILKRCGYTHHSHFYRGFRVDYLTKNNKWIPLTTQELMAFPLSERDAVDFVLSYKN